jgi:hypothetical protein
MGGGGKGQSPIKTTFEGFVGAEREGENKKMEVCMDSRV